MSLKFASINLIIMKKSIFLCVCMFAISGLTYAAPTEVELVDKGHYIPNEDGPRSGKPIVNHDGDDVNIRCDSTINDVDIVIRDQYGTVMHQSTQTIGPNETTIYVPSTDGDSEKTTIDLYYDRKHLSGYFEE